MKYTALFLFTLIVGSGLIAYIGDILGRRLGKARLTLWGLRPRHTAILVTSVTGILIATLTLTVVLATNHTLAKLFIKGEKILTQNLQFQSENAQLISQQDALKASIAEGRSKAKVAAEAVRRAEADVRKAKEAQRKLALLIQSQQLKLSEYAAKLKQEQIKLAQAQQTRAKMQRILTNISQQILELNKKYTQARGESDIWQGGYQELRITPVIFTAGEEIIRDEIAPGGTVADIRARVRGVLDKASAKAAARGAVKGKGFNGRAVVIAPVQFEFTGTTKKFLYQERDSIEAIAQQIHEDGQPAVMRVRALGNSIKGETTLVTVRPLYRNKKAFSKGDLLACEEMNASDSGEEISGNVRKMMAGPVRTAAVQAGIIPRTKANGEEAYFDLDVDKLAATVARIKQTGGMVRVCARAAGNVMIAGPLTLDISVRRR